MCHELRKRGTGADSMGLVINKANEFAFRSCTIERTGDNILEVTRED
jgi:hypothetical protein